MGEKNKHLTINKNHPTFRFRDLKNATVMKSEPWSGRRPHPGPRARAEAPGSYDPGRRGGGAGAHARPRAKAGGKTQRSPGTPLAARARGTTGTRKPGDPARCAPPRPPQSARPRGPGLPSGDAAAPPPLPTSFPRRGGDERRPADPA